MRAPDLGRRAKPVVEVPGRHAHVDDRHVWEIRAHLEEQVGRVPRTSDDGVPSILEQRGDALAQERVIIGNNDAQRSRLAVVAGLVAGCNVG